MYRDSGLKISRDVEILFVCILHGRCWSQSITLSHFCHWADNMKCITRVCDEIRVRLMNLKTRTDTWKLETMFSHGKNKKHTATGNPFIINSLKNESVMTYSKTKFIISTFELNLLLKAHCPAGFRSCPASAHQMLVDG